MKLRNYFPFRFWSALVLLLLSGCGAAVPQEAVIKLNPQQKYQTITGWEATAQAGQFDSKAFDKYKTDLFERAVNDLGINRIRLEIYSGTENPTDFFALWQSGQIREGDFYAKRHEAINDNDDPFVINPDGFHFSMLDSTIEKVVLPMKKLLAERGESLYVNLNYVDFRADRGSSNVRHNDNVEEYAEIILAAFQHIQSKYGFAPDAVEVILEPDTGTGWTGSDIGKAVVAAGKRLRENGFRPEFIAPSTTNAANAPNFIDEIAQIPGAMDYISEFSYHRYSGANEKVLRQIAERAEKYGKNTSMLELIGADYKNLHQDLKVGNNSAWQQYTLAFPHPKDTGGQYFQINDSDVKNPSVTYGKRTYFLRQYFRFIHRGAERVAADTNNGNLDPVAFINRGGGGGGYVVVVKADVPGTISVQNLPAGTYGIVYTTANQAGVDAPDVKLKNGEMLKASIPSVGVITIYAKGSS